MTDELDGQPLTIVERRMIENCGEERGTIYVRQRRQRHAELAKQGFVIPPDREVDDIEADIGAKLATGEYKTR